MTPERALTIGILAVLFVILLILLFGSLDVNVGEPD